ncbi:protein-L-isoaspartate(D-aspartate) O-methyltransferase [Pseudoxanthomonas japonensis]|uniref:protein-L-isoaspartate O-methyltransferase family protein n=1 Tax=Pseudoxanthomonas TaxID=83618 RepID=UPI0007866686|nr:MULTISPECIES: protein-L-isoaspartate O-methyltransferase [Pseudoxanthomonas]MBA3928185.1 protein-L-isoaspartate O-methyltransferase [Xanthomonas sp.]MBL8255728.1 protein-L-isoaspartate O-methyltransferase [Pseudoxanthomonas mexicana]MDR7068212.1 protein-L-isoaspartate(D-aspartate) O-methyltransferase [Pseudoxanthomonas japonensis]
MTINYTQARENMVEQQVRPWDVLDARVLDTLATLPREAFVAESHRALAYADLELPLGHGQTMAKPVIEGRTLQALKPQADEDVLEIGTGSGYLTACLARLARDVVSLEIHPDLADAARARLDATGLGNNVRIEAVDALSWDTDRRFDVICVTGAVATVPARFLPWLRPGGRLFVVRGASPVMEAVLHVADVNGVRIESLFETDLPYLVGAAPAPQFVF